MTNVCPERMLSKASVCMGKGCSLCVVMPMMCVSNGCLWNLHGEGGGVVLFWEGHEITPQGIVHPNILIYDRVSFNLRKNLKPERGWVAHPSRTWVWGCTGGPETHTTSRLSACISGSVLGTISR